MDMGRENRARHVGLWHGVSQRTHMEENRAGTARLDLPLPTACSSLDKSLAIDDDAMCPALLSAHRHQGESPCQIRCPFRVAGFKTAAAASAVAAARISSQLPH